MIDFEESVSRVARKGPLRALALPSDEIAPRYCFYSNDYLNLAKDSALISDANEALCRYGMGSTGARLLSGDNQLSHQLESELAGFIQKPAALLMSSGYHANLGVLSCIASRQDVVFADRFIHASLLDGIALSGAKLIRFLHNDSDDLGRKLAKHRSKFRHAFIVTEGLFSMDGDFSPLTDLVVLKRRFDAHLYVDEAHSIGVVGPEGRGQVAASGVLQDVDFLTIAFGKAFAASGACVLCSDTVKRYLIQCARPFLFSTALTYPVLAWIKAVVQRMPALDSARAVLADKVSRFRADLTACDVLGDDASPIIPVLGFDELGLQRVIASAHDLGYFLKVIRPPTVPQGQSRIRLTLTLAHDDSDLSQLAQVFRA